MQMHAASIVAVYPGSFDPITSGHLDLVQRGARLCQRLIVSVINNQSKEPLFSVSERMEMINECVQQWPNVEVDCFDGLTASYAESKHASFLLRGIRAISDYEYEAQMARMNRRLAPGIDTVFLSASEEHSFISSRLVKEVARLGGSVSGLVPPFVEERLRVRLGQPTSQIHEHNHSKLTYR